MKLQEELAFVFDFQMVDSTLLQDIALKSTYMILTHFHSLHPLPLIQALLETWYGQTVILIYLLFVKIREDTVGIALNLKNLLKIQMEKKLLTSVLTRLSSDQSKSNTTSVWLMMKNMIYLLQSLMRDL